MSEDIEDIKTSEEIKVNNEGHFNIIVILTIVGVLGLLLVTSL